MTRSISRETLSRVLIHITILLIPFYFLRFSVLGIRTNVFEAFAIVTFVVFLTEYCFSLTLKKFNSGSIWIYLFLLASLVGAFLAEDRAHAMGIFKGWFLFPVILYISIINNFNKENINKIAIPVYTSLIAISLWAILQKLGVIGQLFYQAGDASFGQYIVEGRAFGPFESPNFLAMFLVPMIFLSLPVTRVSKNMYLKVMLILSYCLPLIALNFTTSRGGAVALVTSILALLLFLYFKSKVFRKAIEKQSSILIFGLIVVATIFLICAVRKVAPNQGGDNIRIEIYEYSISMIKESPISGIGLGSFQEKIDQVSATNLSFQEYGIRYALHPHNLYMAMWLNLGIAGLMAFIFLVTIAIRNLFKNKTEAFFKSCLFAAMIAILVHGVFDTTYFKNDLAAIFWLAFAMSVIISGKNEKN